MSKPFKVKKTDKKDSKWICDLFKHDLIKFSFIPPKDIRELREITRYRYKLVCMRSSERNRYQNSMSVSNIGLASAVSDPFGKTATKIMKEVLSSSTIDDDTILKLLHKGCKHKDDILASIKDTNITSDQRFKLNEASSHMNELDKHIRSCETEMVKRRMPYYERIKQRRCHKKAIIAIDRMMLVCIYHMLERNEEFNPVDYNSLHNPFPKVKQTINTVDSALKIFQTAGCDISVLQIIS